MRKRFREISFYLLVIALLLTPNLPMPTGGYGPIAPLMYLFIFGLFMISLRGHFPKVLNNNYFRVMIVLQVFLLSADLLRLVLFEFLGEIFYIPIRIVNACIIILFAYYFVEKRAGEKFYNFNKFFLNLYILTVSFTSFILFGQAFKIFTFGMINRGRAFFGIFLPFDKPVGFFDASDGKLGIMVGPLMFLYLASIEKKTAFVKLRWAPLMTLIFAVLIVVLQSRSGYLAMVFGGVVFFLLHPSSIYRIITASAAGLGVLLLLFTDTYSRIVDGLVSQGIYEKNVLGRSEGLSTALEKIFKSPIWGVGHSASRHNRGYLILEEGSLTHNLFLDHFTSGGLLTGLPILLMFLFYFYVSFKLYSIARERGEQKMIGMSIWLISSMVYIFTELNFYRGLYNEFMYLYFALGVLAYLNYQILYREKNLAHS